ncbi:hypothetical protein PQX77_002755 [Marasmius sp. AFHP31]|nr:hypothetical protein PQX77_002755 [Marasmius sp. AFHP31]
MSLPPPTPTQAYCDVSALEAGIIHLPTERFIHDGKPGEVVVAPSLSFLLRHAKTGHKFIFDLGLRKDWENYPPSIVRYVEQVFRLDIPQDVCESLKKGGLSPDDVDAAGHLPGHINVVARTSSDGGWLLLAGDSAHHWRLITGESQIADNISGYIGRCAHVDKKAAEEHIKRLRAFMQLPRTRILLAHDEPWYKENKGGDAFFPGKIPSM